VRERVLSVGNDCHVFFFKSIVVFSIQHHERLLCVVERVDSFMADSRPGEGLVINTLELMLGTLDSAALTSRHNVNLGRIKAFSNEMAVLLPHVLAHYVVLLSSFFNKHLALLLSFVKILSRVDSKVEDLIRFR
jgi:hypothetical protein